VRFEVLAAMKTRVEVLCVATTCRVLAGYLRLREPCCLHLKCEGWSWRQQHPAKHCYPSTWCHNPDHVL